MYTKYEVERSCLAIGKKLHKRCACKFSWADFDAAEKPFEQGFQILEIFASRIQPKFRKISVLLLTSTDSNSELRKDFLDRKKNVEKLRG